MGKPINRGFNKYIKNPIERLFGWEGSEKSRNIDLPSFTLPVGNISNGPTNLSIFGPTGAGELGILSSAPNQDFSGFWGGVNYVWTGGIVDGFRYRKDGTVADLAPTMGVAPLPTLGNLGAYSGILVKGTQYTKSNLQLGQSMHKAYKAGEEGLKEFRLLSGKRIDFLDLKNGRIFELKPFNPRAIKAGQKQLNLYLKELQSPAMLQKYPRLKGIKWEKFLETY